MNGNYCAESKNVEIPVDQIGQITKINCFSTRQSHTIFSGVFLSTTESYMIITNIFKTINLEEQ